MEEIVAPRPPVAEAMKENPASKNQEVEHLVVAVHGIGSQFRYATIQSVERQFAAFSNWPITQPIGAFHPEKLILKPDSPELGAYIFTLPEGVPNAFQKFAFAEVFWADVPERAVDTRNTTEETKEWALTVVDRVRALDRAGNGKSDLIDYEKASAVVDQMVDTIRVLENLFFLAGKAGFFQFDLGALLTDYLGDVQIVADFKDYGGEIFERFATVLGHLDKRYPQLKSIYIIAHSEGTVVSFKAMLEALAKAKSEGKQTWIDKVKGYMTIGSPINKHIVMWPLLWKDKDGRNALRPHPSRVPCSQAIAWRNYYDYGDPVGFDLQITRDWMRDNGWLAQPGKQGGSSFFEFEDKKDDIGFTRYPFPGKAHNDYWDDAGVFRHFIEDVVKRKENEKPPTQAEKPVKPPGTKPLPWVVSWVVPYILCLGLLAAGTYVLYSAFASVLKISEDMGDMTGNVLGISCLIAGITLLSRLPRLDKWYWGLPIGLTAFALGSWAYVSLAGDRTHSDLSFAFPPWLALWHGNSDERLLYGNQVLGVGLLIGLISALLSKYRPKWGMIPLIGLGGLAASYILWKIVGDQSRHPLVKTADMSLWPLALANVAFLYLWWLGALIFDLVYVWHRFIRSNGVVHTLGAIREKAPAHLRA